MTNKGFMTFEDALEILYKAIEAAEGLVYAVYCDSEALDTAMGVVHDYLVNFEEET